MSDLKEAPPTPEAELPGSVNPEAGAVQQADTAGAYLRASLVRIKGGETGILRRWSAACSSSRSCFSRSTTTS